VPRVRCFGSGAFDRRAFAPLGTQTKGAFMLPLEPMTGGGPGPEPEVSAMTDTTGKSTTDKWAARTNAFQFEVTANEHAFLTAKAAEQGLTLEEYIRTCCGFPS